MTRIVASDIEPGVARSRILLSAVAIVTFVANPTGPSLLTVGKVGAWGAFAVPAALAVLLVHLAYSLAMYYAVEHRARSVEELATSSMWCDVGFSAAIALWTPGDGPFYAFFAFAVVAAGFRAGFRRTIVVTAACIGLYLSVMLVSKQDHPSFVLMRLVYLGITGYLVAYLGQQRLNLEARIGELAASEQRIRIARELHDGCVQTLAGVNLRIEKCKDLLQRGRTGVLLAELNDLQASVNSEHDQLRAYMGSLAGVHTTKSKLGLDADTRFSVHADLAGSGAFVEQVLQIVREGIMNVRCHAQAESATLTVGTAGSRVLIKIDDDGVGFRDIGKLPWSIASRVNELRGVMRVSEENPGAHLVINLGRV